MRIASLSEDRSNIGRSLRYRMITPAVVVVVVVVVVVCNTQSSASVLWDIIICKLKSFWLIRLTIVTIFPFEWCTWQPIPAQARCADYHNIEFATLRAFNRYGKLYISFFVGFWLLCPSSDLLSSSDTVDNQFQHTLDAYNDGTVKFSSSRAFDW